MTTDSILLARIAAVLKRTARKQEREEGTVLTWGEIKLNLASAILSGKSGQTELTKNEFYIMYYLMKHAGNIVPRAGLIDYLWDNIETKRGLGYYISQGREREA